MTRADVADSDRLLLGAALLAGTSLALTDPGAGGTFNGIAWFIVSLALLWFLRRGSHAAWVVSCALATVGALLFSSVLLADATATVSFTANENAGPLALVYAANLVLLTSTPIRRLVGRAAAPLSDPQRQTVR